MSIIKVLNCSGYEIFNRTVQYADGCFIYDGSNKKFADFESGVWALSLGHNNKRVNDRLVEQLQTITHTGYRCIHPVVEKAAEKLLPLMELNNGKCLFLSSGSEAVEFSMKLSRKLMESPKYLCLSNHYLSAYGIAGNVIDSENWIALDWESQTDCMDMNYDFSILDKIPFDQIGAFVFEPGNASGKVKLPPKNLIKRISEKIIENNGLIIVDEVTTGFGRTGRWFGYEHYDIRPDMVVCGKGIGNGYPVSAVGLSERVCSQIEEIDFTYAQSHQNDPLGCAVIGEVIDVIKEEQLLFKAEKIGTYLRESLIRLSQKHTVIKEVRGRGLMCAMEMDESMDSELLRKLHKELYDRGFIVGLKLEYKVLRFYPPLIVNKEIIDLLYVALDEVLSNIPRQV